MDNAARIDRRHRVELDAALFWNRQRLDVHTTNISFSGVFLRTSAMPPIQQLIQFHVTIPNREEPLRMLGVVVRTVPPGPEGCGPSGIGVRFYGFDGEDRLAWIRYVSSLGVGDDQGVRAAPAAPQMSEGGRFAASLQVRAPTTTELGRLVAVGFARSMAFFHTSARLTVGDAVVIELIHPTSGDVFAISARVTRAVERPQPGVVVSLDFDGKRRAAFYTFLGVGERDAAPAGGLGLDAQASMRAPAVVVTG
jgi:hypothetical protein